MDYLETAANRESEYNVSRRKLLAMTSGGMAMALAGCTRGNDNTNPNKVNTFVGPLTGHTSSDSEIQFNPHNVTLEPSTRTQTALFPYFAVPSRKTNEWIPVAAKDWSVDGKTFTITLIDGLTWHNGDAVTADDVVRSLKLNAYMGGEISKYIESADAITKSDEKTTTVSLTDTFNADGIYSNVFQNIRIDAPKDTFGKYIKQFADASSKSDREKVQAEVGEFRWTEPGKQACGPYKLDSITNQSVTCKRYADYPLKEIQANIKEKLGYDLTKDYGTDPGFSTMKFLLLKSQNQVNERAQDDKIDGGNGLNIAGPEELKKNYPDYAEYRPVPNGYGTSIMFNMINGEHADAWRTPNVRKALAHIIDLESVAKQFYGEYTDTRRRFSGLTPLLENDLFDEEFLNSLTTYKRDTKKAESLLNDAGYTKKDGKWHKPNGDKLKATFEGPTSVSFYIDGWKFAASNLKEFGIESEVKAIDGSTFFSKTLGNLNWNLTRSYYGAPNPPLAYKRSWVRYDGPEKYDYSAYLEKPLDSSVVTVPEIGKPDSSKTTKINILDTYESLTKTSDEKKLTKLAEKLSWAYNQTVPRIPIGQVQGPWYMTNDVWKYPPADHALGQVSPFTWSLSQIGALKTKSK